MEASRKERGASHKEFQRICTEKFHCDNRPDRKMGTECIDSSHSFHGSQHAAFTGNGHEGASVDHIYAVKNISMDGDHDRNECEYTSLKLIFGHTDFSFFLQKNTHRPGTLNLFSQSAVIRFMRRALHVSFMHLFSFQQYTTERKRKSSFFEKRACRPPARRLVFPHAMP